MDQIKIGKFISSCRKEKGLTQSELANKLNITDRAISKWETGKSMPDSSLMLELCEILSIDVNELLKGEKIDMEKYKEISNENLIELKKEIEDKNKQLLNIEILIGIPIIIAGLIVFFIAFYFDLNDWIRVLFIVYGLILIFICCFICIKIEQEAGYYQCIECSHKYIPTYSNVLFAPHIGRTRYMKCPKCSKKSWQKKVIK